MAGITPGVTAQNPFFGQSTAIPASPFPSSGAGFLAVDFRNAYSSQWNFEIQRELAANLALSAAYVGSHSLRLSVGGDYNTAIVPGPGPIANRQLWPVLCLGSKRRSFARNHRCGLLWIGSISDLCPTPPTACISG